jgi:four helix bundle protein
MSLPHHNLVVWQRADDLFIEVHRLTLQRFPVHERFELGSQIRRAGWSVPSNIVEGIARRSRRDSIRFFEIASASLREVGYGLHAARRLGDIDTETSSVLEDKLRMVAAPLNGLVNRYRLRGALTSTAGAISVLLLLRAVFHRRLLVPFRPACRGRAYRS